MNIEILKEIGFTQGEIKVYEALLEIGESTIGLISKTANVTPSKTYPILDKLLKKGLISKVKKGKVLYFWQKYLHVVLQRKEYGGSLDKIHDTRSI